MSPEKHIIEISEVSSGSAPEKMKAAWKGLKFLAEETDLNTTLVDPIKRETLLPMFGYRVSRTIALNALRTVGRYEAANYFEEMWPEGMDFIFMPDDVKFEEEE